ncbi:MAG: ECF transporter S component [Clostridia bacterium]|nr:ECF transporter S component [Clostridia bacterium]
MDQTLKFVLICLAIVVGLYILSVAFERLFCKSRKKISAAKYAATVGMCGALAGLFMFLEIPLLFLAPEFYKLDLSELPVMICSFYLGPAAGVLTEFIKILMKLLFKSTTTAFVGELANFAVGCAFVLPASMIYHIRKTKKTAIVGLSAGTICLTCFGSFFNAIYLLPAFAALFGIPLDVIIGMGTEINSHITSVSTFVLFAVAPLNLIKGVLVSVLTFLLYKRFEKVLFKRM